MKKLLIIILIVLLLVLSGYVIIQGTEIGPISILSITSIRAKNSELDTKIQEATKLASTDYKKIISEITTNTKKLQEEKESYENMVAISSSTEVVSANQLEKYEVEYLWTKLGNHATSEGITIKLDIVQSAVATEGTYNLNLTATGSYLGITDFIYDIENDSSLGFKIEEFKLQPQQEGNDLIGTFTCKDVEIKDVQVTTSGSNETDENNTSNNTTGNNTSGNVINMNNTSNKTSNNTSSNTNSSNTSNTAKSN